MKQRRRLFLVLVLLLLVAGLMLVPQVRWPIYGWLRGEAFYQGMPTSYWEKEIEESYDVSYGVGLGVVSIPIGEPVPKIWFVRQPSSVWDQLWQRVTLGKSAIPVMDVIVGGPLLDGDAAALPMLLILIRNDSGKVRRVAISGLLAQGKQRPDVLPALLQAVEDPDDEVRQDAIAALQLVDPEAAATAGIK